MAYINSSYQHIFGIILAHGTLTRIVRHLSFQRHWVTRSDSRGSRIRGSLHVSTSALLQENIELEHRTSTIEYRASNIEQH